MIGSAPAYASWRAEFSLYKGNIAYGSPASGTPFTDRGRGLASRLAESPPALAGVSNWQKTNWLQIRHGRCTVCELAAATRDRVLNVDLTRYMGFMGRIWQAAGDYAALRPTSNAYVTMDSTDALGTGTGIALAIHSVGDCREDARAASEKRPAPVKAQEGRKTRVCYPPSRVFSLYLCLPYYMHTAYRCRTKHTDSYSCICNVRHTYARTGKLVYSFRPHPSRL